MTASRKTGIRRSIEKLLIPALVARGFEQSPATESALLEPFGRFLRRTNGVEIIVIRFNKDRTSHFHFHIARATTPDAIWADAPIPVEDQWPMHVRPNYLVWKRGLVFRHWFGVRKKAREGIEEREYDAAVVEAVARLPLIDRYFERGTTTLAMGKYPRGPADDWPYRSLCITVVLGTLFAGACVLGWIIRHV